MHIDKGIKNMDDLFKKKLDEKIPEFSMDHWESALNYMEKEDLKQIGLWPVSLLVILLVLSPMAAGIIHFQHSNETHWKNESVVLTAVSTKNTPHNGEHSNAFINAIPTKTPNTSHAQNHRDLVGFLNNPNATQYSDNKNNNESTLETKHPILPVKKAYYKGYFPSSKNLINSTISTTKISKRSLCFAVIGAGIVHGKYTDFTDNISPFAGIGIQLNTRHRFSVETGLILNQRGAFLRPFNETKTPKIGKLMIAEIPLLLNHSYNRFNLILGTKWSYVLNANSAGKMAQNYDGSIVMGTEFQFNSTINMGIQNTYGLFDLDETIDGKQRNIQHRLYLKVNITK